MTSGPLVLVAELGSSALKHDGAVRQVAVTPDGKKIVSVGDGRMVHVWDATTGQHLADLVADAVVYTVAISPDGRRVLATGHCAQVFDLRAGQAILSPRVHGIVTTPAFGPDGGFMFSESGVTRRFTADGRYLRPLAQHPRAVTALAISRDGRRALTSGHDHKLKLHALDTTEPTVIATWDGLVTSCGFSPDGTLVWSVGWDRATVRGTTSGRVTFDESFENARGGAMSLDGSRFAVAVGDAVVVYELPGKRVVSRIAFAASSIAFTPDATRLVVAPPFRKLTEDPAGTLMTFVSGFIHAGDGISVFDVASERRVLPADTGHSGAVEGLAIAAAMPHAMFSVGADGYLLMWDLDTGTAIERIGSVPGPGRSIACSADGTTLYTSSWESGLVAWNITRTERTAVSASNGSGLDIAISPDDRYLAYLSTDRSLQIFERATLALVARIPVEPHRAGALAFTSADVIVWSAADGTATALKLPSGTREWALAGDNFLTVLCVAGDSVVIGNSAGELGVRGALRPRIVVLRERGHEIYRVCSLGDDHVAVLQRPPDFESSSLEVWNLSGRRMLGKTDLAVRARCLTASPDGRRIYVGTNTSRVLVFERA